MQARSKLSSVILWSVISAAFIGPGTVTTAVTVGSRFGIQLLWAVAFSTIACIILMEVSARISISSGLTFGEALIKRFGSRYGKLSQFALGGIVIAGCAAYQAGNILGAVSGLSLLTGIKLWLLTILVVVSAGFVLWIGKRERISRIMIALVACMGVAFVALALTQDFDHMLSDSYTNLIPNGSELLVLGLIGTTIVPYTIFIGSGISKGQTIPLMRIGLTVSILIGGLITMAIVVAGASVQEFTSFEILASTLKDRLGTWGYMALSLGLFAAGFSSSITSPYAASLITSNVFGLTKPMHIRLAWSIVMLTGFLFGVSGTKPIPVILTVQALNGFILPLLTLFLILIVNDRRIVIQQDQHGGWYNIVLLLILFVMLMIGLNNVDRAIVSAFNLSSYNSAIVLTTSLIVTALSFYVIFRSKRSEYVAGE